MSQKYHLDQNEVAFLHCVNSAFAGLDYGIKLIEKEKLSKKKLLQLIKETLRQTNTAICSEYIRGELIKKGVVENGESLLCTFDPTVDNDNAETEVFTQDELDAIRLQEK